MKYLKLFDNLNESLSDQTEYALKYKLKFYKKRHPESGLSYGILKQVYKRGFDAWHDKPRKDVNAHINALTRVNSFLTKGFSWKTADKDLAEKVLKAARKQKHKKYFGKYEPKIKKK